MWSELRNGYFRYGLFTLFFFKVTWPLNFFLEVIYRECEIPSLSLCAVVPSARPYISGCLVGASEKNHKDQRETINPILLKGPSVRRVVRE